MGDSIFLGNCHSVYDFKKEYRIGEGTYGFVYKGIEKSTNKVVALKRIILHNEEREGFPLTSLREVKILKHCSNHKNIIKLEDVLVGNQRDGVFLLFEYCEHDLSKLYKKLKNPFRESEIKCLIMQLLKALEYLHKNWIIHRDIKLSNLLYNSRGELKLADFGLARTITHKDNSNLTPIVVTLWYRSPELLLGTSYYSFSIDMWSVGCILGEMLLGDPLLPGSDEIDQIYLIFDLLGAPNERIWPDITKMPLVMKKKINLDRESHRYVYNKLQDRFPDLSINGINILNELFTYNPSYRINARDALKHPYFDCNPYPCDPDFMPTFPESHIS